MPIDDETTFVDITVEQVGLLEGLADDIDVPLVLFMEAAEVVSSSSSCTSTTTVNEARNFANNFLKPSAPVNSR
jgi:hypothetical protein